ncbi:uncharacterized protein [Physcomitrium patens]|uniref:Uncharacterized protein n=1 Tax=Physcomitrium patens TaxID=3218 RepID=A0A2K1L1P9_PHYPA|nr:uncharacterized protein LOC112279042 [Physcomitrium patens]XP_024368868.1 uncharacterized protein LOC112279042 [Physcomitrium patens]PNR59950.1 hypothetical protein PHYPA_002742 [Physcomitrium patens]|eukprot:XP_024368867.1 uncharacterized protein LOC112279042 [Physcomitrella patens]
MAACFGAKLSLSSCSSVSIRGPKSLPSTSRIKSQHPYAAFPIKTAPLRIEGQRKLWVAFNSLESASSVQKEKENEAVSPDGAEHVGLSQSAKEMVMRKIKNKYSKDEDEDEIPVQDGAEEGAPLQVTQEQVMELVKERYAEMDLEEAAEKYDLEEELFAEVDYAQIDAFTDQPFSGNPAVVCYIPYERDDRWLQTIAREFNLPATAFLVKRRHTRSDLKSQMDTQRDSGSVQVDESGTSLEATTMDDSLSEENEFDLRVFTPTYEVVFCGHGTLASAHLLFTSGIVEGDIAVFHTKSGILKAKKVSGYEEYEQSSAAEESGAQRKPSSKGVIELDLPLAPPSVCNDMSFLSEALGGVEVKWVGRSNLGDYLLELESSEDVVNLTPRFERMLDFPGRGGVIVTASAAGSSEYDFVSRFFCAKMGLNEDSATGSAHCTLGPYWASKLGKTELNAYQASVRGGKFKVRVDEDAGRCYLLGDAVFIMGGVLLNSKYAGYTC